MFKYIQSIKIHKLQWFSDHCQISVQFNKQYIIDWASSVDAEPCATDIYKHFNYKWDENSTGKFRTAIKSEITLSKINQTMNNIEGDIETTCSDITEILTSVAEASCDRKTLRLNINTQPPRDEIPEKFKSELKEAKRRFRNALDSYQTRTGDFNRRQTMIRTKKVLKKLIYLIERDKKENKIAKIIALENKDPKQFWAHIKRLTKKRSNKCSISASKWYNYFRGLLNVNPEIIDQSFLDYVKCSLPTIEANSQIDEDLNEKISKEEVVKTVKSLKNAKAAGPDRITNEMIKNAGSPFYSLLTGFYNRILSSGTYPKAWKMSIISTIYKAGDANMPSNYRGVAVSSALHKVFTKILNNRIVRYMTDNNKWSQFQNGFMEKRRTEDNIFILHSLFNKYVKQSNSKIYVAYIDFRKFFDIINRDHLMYKLLGIGITGPVYNLIKSMYDGTRFCIKTESGLTQYFESNSGVLQGCNLSPTLSNIFQADLHKIFSEGTDPLEIYDDIKINSLSWADDLVLMSTTQKGLQTCLNNLNEYCKKWGLSINVNKTKTMVMEKGKSFITDRDFSIAGKPIECVQTYKYLGFIISFNGSFKKAIDDRIDKGTKCVYAIRNAISHNTNISTRLANTIFNKQVSPILTYGCPLWILPKPNNTLKISMRLDRYANVQIKNSMENLLGRELNVIKSTIDRSLDTVTITLDNWQDKLSILRAVQTRPFTGIIQNVHPETNSDKIHHDIDKVHAKMSKFALGVSKFTSNTAVFRELGQIPVSVKAQILAVMYFYRLNTEINSENNTLLHAAFNCMRINSHPWLDSVHHFFAVNGLSDLYNKVLMRGVSKGKLKNQLKRRLSDIYQQNNSESLKNKPYLEGLYKFTESEGYKMQKYLRIVSSPQLRNIYARVRTNSSKLSPNPYTQVIEQCDKCGTLRDFKHLLLHCENFRSEREKFKTQLKNVGCNLDPISDDFYEIIMTLDFSELPNRSQPFVTPIILSFVGILGRMCII